MTTAQFAYGASVPVRLEFRDENDALVDPDTVSASLIDRTDLLTPTTVSVTRASLGVWTGWITGPAPGPWLVRGVGAFTGPPAYTVVVEEPFDVQASVFA